jgi:acetolactate synthase II small subunit
MNHVLTIQTRNQAVVLERLLQVTRYRGFQLAGLEMKPLAEQSGLLITLSVITDKPIHLLTNQLNKLVDVQQLELASETLTALRA